MIEAIGVIDIENVNRCASFGRIPNKARPIPVKMLITDVIARMEETCDLPRQ